MDDLMRRLESKRLWNFTGGIHPPEMKSQSNTLPIQQISLPNVFYIPVKQHIGRTGELLVNVGDVVLKGQPLTAGGIFSELPIHAPTSGKVIAIQPYIATHPSGLTELTIAIQADNKDQAAHKETITDFSVRSPHALIDKIYRYGIAGLGGAAYPTAEKLKHISDNLKLLIINGAECEPYITCDDRLMRDYSTHIITGIQILIHILNPQKVIIAIEDNKPEAINSIQEALDSLTSNQIIELRIIPTKYPSGASRQLIQILTGYEVPMGKHSISLGILVHNVATAFAIKKAIIDDEPLIERVVTLTGGNIPIPRNVWVRLGTPINYLLQQVDYQYNKILPVFMGGPLMGFMLSNLASPITKMSNCIIAPDNHEYSPPPLEKNCIRCSLCSDACPISLMPQQLYWFARNEEHEKSTQYALHDCIECGICAYVCPSNIPLVQYFRQEKAKILKIKQNEAAAESAKNRFEARHTRLEKERQEREHRLKLATKARREEMMKQQGIDPVKAALDRINARKSATIETLRNPDHTTLSNSEITAQRKARKQKSPNTLENNSSTNTFITNAITDTNANDIINNDDAKKKAVAAAIARAKAKKQAMQQSSDH